jgi:uncharacterized membrane protein
MVSINGTEEGKSLLSLLFCIMNPKGYIWLNIRNEPKLLLNFPMYLFFLYLMSGLYVLAGILHFVKPKMYIRIIPPYLPYPRILNYLAGAFEILLGIGLLFEQTRSVAAFGLILLLLAVFPANIYMYQHGAKNIPKWVLFLRLPLQFVLIAWAYLYT